MDADGVVAIFDWRLQEHYYYSTNQERVNTLLAACQVWPIAHRFPLGSPNIKLIGPSASSAIAHGRPNWLAIIPSVHGIVQAIAPKADEIDMAMPERSGRPAQKCAAKIRYQHDVARARHASSRGEARHEAQRIVCRRTAIRARQARVAALLGEPQSTRMNLAVEGTPSELTMKSM